MKFGLGLGDPGGQLFNALQNAGWFIKPFWDSISDRVPLFGYHRKSWFVLMALLALSFGLSTRLSSFSGCASQPCSSSPSAWHLPRMPSWMSYAML
jgi:hypothetical protein